MAGSPPESLLVPAPRASAKRSGAKLAAAAGIMAVVAVGAVRLGGGTDSRAMGRDNVSADETARRAVFTSTLAPVGVRVVSLSEQAAAVAAMTLPATERTALAADLASGRTRLIWMSFFDSDVEDGDVITVQSGGFSRTSRLTKAPVAIALPAPPDGRVRIVGTIDGGGGGVTVGIVTPSGPVPLAVLSVGQAISVPVAAE